MPSPKPTAEVTTTAEQARRAAIKREICAELAEQSHTTATLDDRIDGISQALIRQLANELADAGDLSKHVRGGRAGTRYELATTREVAADD